MFNSMHGLKRAISTNLFHRIYRLLTGESKGANPEVMDPLVKLLVRF